MRKINSVLVPVDFSPNSLEALKYAAHIAYKNSYKINLLNVVSDRSYVVTYPDYGITSPYVLSTRQELVSGLKNDNEKRLGNLAGLKIFKGIITKTRVITDNSVYQGIVDYAEESRSGLIVMGTRGTTSAKKIFLGTNAERVIRLTSKPVIAIGRNVGHFKIRKVIFASDFSKEAYSAYPVVNEVIGSFKAYVHLLRISTGSSEEPNDKILKEMDRFRRRYSGKFIPFIKSNREIDEGIVKYAHNIRADLIVLGVHRKKGISRMLGNRILEGILRLTRTPVLAVDIP